MTSTLTRTLARSLALTLAGASAVAAAGAAKPTNWPQAAGPNGTWSVEGKDVPTHWSVTRNENIVWRTALPEEGQSGISVWGDKLFLTTMKPMEPYTGTHAPQGHDVVGYCLDSRNGKILWTADLPGTENSDYAYGFSDPSTPSPITDGKHVWFYNSAGSLGCYDFAGKQSWLRTWKPTTGRPFNKQFEPMLVGNTLINLEPRDPDDPKREKDAWNYLRGLDKLTGKSLWVSEDGLTHYNTPCFGMTADGKPAVLQGRGGHHDVPETPTGLTLTSLAPGSEGKALWRYAGAGKTLYTMHWDSKYAYWFPEDTSEHLVLDAANGKLLRKQSLVDKVDWRRYDPAAGKYVFDQDVDLKKQNPPLRVFPAWFTNIPVAGWDYFLCFTDKGAKCGPPYCLGRVNIESGKVEYLELPVGVIREEGKPDRAVWGQPLTSSTVNSRGIDVAGDRRSTRDGWYWCFLGSPTAVDGKIFITNMLGQTYVIDGRAPVLDEKALLAVNDLGPVGKTWSLNSVSYAGGHLYHRSIKEVVCIGKP